MNISLKKIPLFEFVFIIFCTLYFIIPEAQRVIPFYVAITIEILYSIYLIIQKKIDIRFFLKMVILITVVALLYMLLTDVSSISSDVSNIGLKRFLSKFFRYSCMFFPLLLLKRCVTSGTKKQNLIVLIVALIAILLSCKTILDLIAINPLAARDFGFRATEEELQTFIAPYPFIYGMTFVFVAMFFFSIHASKMSHGFRIFAYCLLAFFFYFLIKSQFTLSLLTSIISVIVVIICKLKSPATKLVFSVVMIILFCFLPYIIDYFIIPYLPEMLSSRFSEVRDFLLGSADNDSDLKGRLTLYGKTIEVFLQSPLLGNRTYDFDGHATYLTIWADLGVLGGTIIMYLIFSAKRMVERSLGVLSFCFLPFFIHLLLNGFTNPIHASLQIYISLWFLIPLSILTFKDKLSLWKLPRL